MRGENILVHPRFAVGTKYEVARTDYNFIFCPYSKTSFGDLPEYSLLSHDLQPGGTPLFLFDVEDFEEMILNHDQLFWLE